MSDTPLYIPFLQPAATIAAALAVGYYAHQQWKLAQDKLRLDLFEKRYKVFEAARKFLLSISNGDFKDEQMAELFASTSGVDFLFDEEVADI